MHELTLKQYVDNWCADHPEHTDLELFNLGKDFADPDDIFERIMSWRNTDPIIGLVFKLLKHRKINVAEVIEQYTKYLTEITREKSEQIDELSINLITFRHKIYTAKDIDEWNARADNSLKKSGWERNSINK